MPRPVYCFSPSGVFRLTEMFVVFIWTSWLSLMYILYHGSISLSRKKVKKVYCFGCAFIFSIQPSGNHRSYSDLWTSLTWYWDNWGFAVGLWSTIMPMSRSLGHRWSKTHTRSPTLYILKPHCWRWPTLVLKGVLNLSPLCSAKFIEPVALRHLE